MLYAAPSGEPALGPVAFMHRPSAMDNPTAPISHHWQDATHISFGVLSAGVFTHSLKLEGSVFNSREPDQHRFNFDPPRLDSYSGRVTWNPEKQWSLTAGYGVLKSLESLPPPNPCTVRRHRCCTARRSVPTASCHRHSPAHMDRGRPRSHVVRARATVSQPDENDGADVTASFSLQMPIQAMILKS